MYKHKYVPVVILLLFTLIWAAEDGVTQTTKKPIQTDAITIPKLLNYQGKLTNLAGNPVNDSTYSITFRLFAASSGGSSFWDETQNVQTHIGLFNVLLGSNSQIDSIPQAGSCYLEMQVNPNSAMTPRIRLVSSAYAYLAKKADTANYAPLARPITPALTTSEIADDAITNIKLGADAVTTDKILNGTILRADAVNNFKAPYSDTADYARASSVTYVDSARVATNAYNADKLQGKDTTALDTRFVNEGQANSITSSMITDNTIVRNDVMTNFKSPYADTSDYARVAPVVDSVRIAVTAYNAYKLQGMDTTALSAKFVDENQTNAISNAMLQNNAVTSTKIQDSTITRADVIKTFKSPYADTSDYARAVNVPYVDSARVAVNAYNGYKLQGKDTIALSAKFVDEGQVSSITNPMLKDSAVTSVKIQDNTINRNDVATNFKAPYSDTADYVRNINLPYVDSTRISVNAYNAYKLQGKDTLALDSRYVNEGQTNSVNSPMIIDNTITRNDVATDFKAPLADTADYARVIPGAIDSARIAATAYNAYKLQGKDTIALSTKFVDEGQANSITSSMITDNTITRNDVATNFKAPYADSADYVKNISVPYVDSSRIAVNAYNAYKLQGKDTTALDARYVNEGQTNSVTSSMITDSTIVRNDVATNFKAPYSDTSDYVRNINVPYVDSTRIAVNAYNAYTLQGKDTIALSAKFIDEGQIAGGDLTGTYPNPTITSNAINAAKIADTNVTMTKIQQAGAIIGQVIKWNGSAWAPRVDSVGIADNAWVRGSPDSVLFTISQLGIARGGADNMLWGTNRFTHTNLGVACTTGTSGQNSLYSTISGGHRNNASDYATVSGGSINNASGGWATIGGGALNTASGNFATIGGGEVNTASNILTTIGGGYHGITSGYSATIGGGFYNRARGDYSVVSGGGGASVADSNSAMGVNSVIGGGHGNIASGDSSTIGGGARNTTSGTSTTIGGGISNTASGYYATVSGGDQNTTSGDLSTIGGGAGNTASNIYSTIGGGQGNTASNIYATVGGGHVCIVSGYGATIGGGFFNKARADYSVVSGGGGFSERDSNSAMGVNSAIGGGHGNIASGDSSTISGGARNKASSTIATVGGGYSNTASGAYSTVGGGYYNTASGAYSTVPSGISNTASGNYSLATGRRAKANHTGTFVWADSTNADFASTGANQFLIRANGNVGINTNSPSSPLTVNGIIQSTTGGIKFPDNSVQTTAAAGSGVYLPLGGGTMTGAITNTGDPAITMGKGNFGTGNINPGTQAFVAGSNNKAQGNYSVVGGGGGAIVSDSNSAIGNNSTISGGHSNVASGDTSTISGGTHNTASGLFASVGGGAHHIASGLEATVSGGYWNFASGGEATVGGGTSNVASNTLTTIGGGTGNSASGYGATIGGGIYNKARGIRSVVGGGGGATPTDSNSALGWNSAITGGIGNIASGDSSFIGGGARNIANNTCATIGGGNYNTASGGNAFVGGGEYNKARGNYSVVSGGGGSNLSDSNSALGKNSTIGGGLRNIAKDSFTTVGGGYNNSASAICATVSGGYNNIASYDYGTVGGGINNRARGQYSVVSGGGGLTLADSNSALGIYSAVVGGSQNYASSSYSFVGGGQYNTASGGGSGFATVSGGKYNRAYGFYSTVAGGLADTSMGNYSFTVGNHSVVPSSYANSVAFNGQTATASNQTIVANIVATGAKAFAIDHPLDPQGKILNHYCIESPEMVLIYRGSAIIDADGKAEITLPDYFDALNKNPMVQLTGVGSADVFVAQEVTGNSFVIGGKSGTKVYWTVTGERKDQNAEIAKILMPVEQPKTGDLTGCSLDDNYLVGTLNQLKEMGKAAGFSFRTAQGRSNYDNMQKTLQEAKQHENK